MCLMMGRSHFEHRAMMSKRSGYGAGSAHAGWWWVVGSLFIVPLSGRKGCDLEAIMGRTVAECQ